MDQPSALWLDQRPRRISKRGSYGEIECGETVIRRKSNAERGSYDGNSDMGNMSLLFNMDDEQMHHGSSNADGASSSGCRVALLVGHVVPHEAAQQIVRRAAVGDAVDADVGIGDTHARNTVALAERGKERGVWIPGSGRRQAGQVANPRPLTEYDPEHPYIVAMYDLEEAG